MSDVFNFDDDVILPEGFDPNSESYEFSEGEPSGETAPTTEPVAETGVPAEPSAAAEPAPTTVPEPVAVPIPQTIKVKFNHEERELTFDEAARYAQMGMNYDKLQERLNGFEAQNAKSDRLAKNLGYADANEMIAAAEQNYYNRQVKELMEDGNTEAMAKFLVDQRMAKAAEVERQAQQPQEQPTPAPSNSRFTPERRAELDEFVRAYPGVTKLPDEVITANRNGVRLLVAYERYQNKKALDELAILRQNQAAAARAPVSGVTGKAGTPPAQAEDPFLKGLEADW